MLFRWRVLLAHGFFHRFSDDARHRHTARFSLIFQPADNGILEAEGHPHGHGSSLQPAHVVVGERRVVGHERQALHAGLGNQHAVERVGVVAR